MMDITESEYTVRVAIAEDQRLITKMLAALVNSQEDMELVGEASDGREAVNLCRVETPDVILMDVFMPVMDGITATRRIRDISPSTRVLILTASEDDKNVIEGIQAGALGYLNKNCSPRDLADAIRTVFAGNVIVSSSTARQALEIIENRGTQHPQLSPPLTERELEVIRNLARGMSNREIARELYISENTVRNHTANIYKKLQINDRTRAVLYAVREGILDPDEIDNV